MPVRLATALTARLRSEIIEGRLRAGDRLPTEADLSSDYGVSRTVVREAIADLRAEGLARSIRGSGTFVLAPPLDPDSESPHHDPGHVLGFRLAIETEAAALAARNRPDDAVITLEAAAKTVVMTGGDPAASMRADFELHRAIAAASGNPLLVRALTGLGATTIGMPPGRLRADSAHVARTGQEHTAIVEAIADRDPRAAAAAMRTHLSRTLRDLRASYPSDI